MKLLKGLLVICLVAVAGCQHAAPAPVPPGPNKDWQITATILYDFTNFAPCSSTVTKGCVSSFTWGYLQGSTPIPLKTSPVSICSGTTQPETCVDSVNSTVGIGAITPYAIANGFDNSGAAVVTTQTTAPPVNVAIGTVAGITLTLK